MHDLFLELEMFKPDWKDRYPSIREAATAAKCLDIYTDWLTTEEGIAYTALMANVPDIMHANEVYKKAREKLNKWNWWNVEAPDEADYDL